MHLNHHNILFFFAGVKGERYPVAGRAVSGMMNQFCWYLSIKYISITGNFCDDSTILTLCQALGLGAKLYYKPKP